MPGHQLNASAAGIPRTAPIAAGVTYALVQFAAIISAGGWSSRSPAAAAVPRPRVLARSGKGGGGWSGNRLIAWQVVCQWPSSPGRGRMTRYPCGRAGGPSRLFGAAGGAAHLRAVDLALASANRPRALMLEPEPVMCTKPREVDTPSREEDRYPPAVRRSGVCQPFGGLVWALLGASCQNSAPECQVCRFGRLGIGDLGMIVPVLLGIQRHQSGSGSRRASRWRPCLAMEARR